MENQDITSQPDAGSDFIISHVSQGPKFKKLSSVAVILSIFLVAGVSGYFVWMKSIESMTTEVLLGTISKTAEVFAITISPDLNHYALRVREGNTFYVVYDGQAQKPYDNVYDFIFSPDSKQFAYTARVGKKSLVVLNGKEGNMYDYVSKPPSGFGLNEGDSRDSRFNLNGQFFYIGYVGPGTPLEKQAIVIDGKEVGSWPMWLQRTESPDGKGFSYVSKGKKGYIVNYTTKDGSGNSGYDSKEYLKVSSFKWSLDGKHFAYQALDHDGKYMMVVDGVEGNRHDLILDFTFKWSLDGTNFSYVAKHSNGKDVVVVNGQESDEYYLTTPPIFSPDSKKIVFGGYRESTLNVTIIVNRTEGATHQHVSDFTFSPDGTHFAYAADEGGDRIIFINGEERARYPIWLGGGYGHDVPSILFSKDSKRVAFMGHEGGCSNLEKCLSVKKELEEKYFIVIDGKSGKKYDKVYLAPDSFSLDGKSLTYVAFSEGSIYKITDTLKPPFFQFAW